MTIGENYYYGGLFRFDLSPKPAYYKIKELLEDRWHTEESTVSNEKGISSFRGFYGKYGLTIAIGDRVFEKEINLTKNGNNNFEIVI